MLDCKECIFDIFCLLEASDVGLTSDLPAGYTLAD